LKTHDQIYKALALGTSIFAKQGHFAKQGQFLAKIKFFLANWPKIVSKNVHF